jgi:hypothetical protein
MAAQNWATPKLAAKRSLACGRTYVVCLKADAHPFGDPDRALLSRPRKQNGEFVASQRPKMSCSLRSPSPGSPFP